MLHAADGVSLDAAWHGPSAQRVRGVIVQAHGINADMDEGGMFRGLADGLASEGFGVLRFSFRGHGRSGGMQRGATIAGEMLDLAAAAVERFELGYLASPTSPWVPVTAATIVTVARDGSTDTHPRSARSPPGAARA